MSDLNNSLAKGFLAECGEQLMTLEAELLALENGGAARDVERAERAFRLVHSIRGGAYVLDLAKLADLAHGMEDVIGLICSGEMRPDTDPWGVLLRTTDRLHELIGDAATSNQADIGALLAELAEIAGTSADPPAGGAASTNNPPSHGPARRLRILLVEDDFTSRLVLQTFLSRYGECHVAVNGREAVEACGAALQEGRIYDLICMDIMMPEMDGREAVHRIRVLEEAEGISFTHGAKIIMTTTVADIKKVFQCFKELCDGYLVKPIDLSKLMGYMESWGLVGAHASVRSQPAFQPARATNLASYDRMKERARSSAG